MAVVYETIDGTSQWINNEIWSKKVYGSRQVRLDRLVDFGVLLRHEPPIYMAKVTEAVVAGRVIAGTNYAAAYPTGPALDYLGVTTADSDANSIVTYRNDGEAAACAADNIDTAMERLTAVPGGYVSKYLVEDLAVESGGGTHHFTNGVWKTGGEVINVHTAADDANAQGAEITFIFIDDSDEVVREAVNLDSDDSSTIVSTTQLCKKLVGFVVGTLGNGTTQDLVIEDEDTDVCYTLSSGYGAGSYGAIGVSSIFVLGNRVKILCDADVTGVLVLEGVKLFESERTYEIWDNSISADTAVYSTNGYDWVWALWVGGDGISGETYTVTCDKSQASVGKPLDDITAGNLGDILMDKDTINFIARALDFKKFSVRQATTGALAPACTYNNGDEGEGAYIEGDANNPFTAQDGVTLAVHDILLVKNQVDATENGIYKVIRKGSASSTFKFERVKDFDTQYDISSMATVLVEEGTTNGGTLWALNIADPPVIGTTDLDWILVAGSGVIDADTVDGLDSTAFAILAGQSGGQTLNGGTDASDNLVLSSTADSTKGEIQTADTLLQQTFGNSAVWVNLGTIVESDLTESGDGNTEAIDLSVQVPAGSIIHDMVVYVTTQFTGGGATTVTAAVGLVADPNGYTVEHDVLGCGDGTWVSEGQDGTDKGEYLYVIANDTRISDFRAAATTVQVEFAPDVGHDLADLTAGSLTVWALVSKIEE